MSQWAREHPELCEEGISYEDIHDPDRIRQEIKDGERSVVGTKPGDRSQRDVSPKPLRDR